MKKNLFISVIACSLVLISCNESQKSNNTKSKSTENTKQTSISSNNNIIELSANDNFNAIINSEIPVMVDFYATWCKPCMQQSPILEEIATEQNGAMKLLKVDVDKFPELSQIYNVRSIPMLLLFKNGEEIWTAVGLQEKAKLVTEIENAK
jgi:thioredoxin 1